MFINGHPSHCRPGNRGLFDKLPVRLVEPSPAVPVVVPIGTAVAEQGIHGITPQARGPTSGSLLRAKKIIRWAFVYTQRIACETSQDAILYVGHVRVAFFRAPRHHIVDPVVELFRTNGVHGSGYREIVADPVLEVIGIHVPRQNQLLVIAHAHNALGLGFRLAQCWQEHGGQDRDDGDDYQQLNQGKSACDLRMISRDNGNVPIRLPAGG